MSSSKKPTARFLDRNPVVVEAGAAKEATQGETLTRRRMLVREAGEAGKHQQQRLVEEHARRGQIGHDVEGVEGDGSCWCVTAGSRDQCW